MAGEVATFEAERSRLTRLAYRMLGSVSEAQDVVQDAWLRWDRATDEVLDPAAWLVRVTSRLCLDRMRSAKARREDYRGPWLPEPLIEELSVDPLERAEDVSVAFLLALERLSPLERAVFLLHDVFDADYAQVAQTLERSEISVRQLASRARGHLKAAKPRFTVSQDEATKLAIAFMAAAYQGDLASLSKVLADDAVMITDGGGKRPAALRVMTGPEDIVRLLQGLAWRGGQPWAMNFRAARINGYLGLILDLDDGLVTLAFEPGPDEKLSGIYLVRNPDKLGHLVR